MKKKSCKKVNSDASVPSIHTSQTMSSSNTPKSPTLTAQDLDYPTTGIYALGYLDDTYPHQKIGSGTHHTPTSPARTPTTASSATFTFSSEKAYSTSTAPSTKDAKSVYCASGKCHHSQCKKNRKAAAGIRKSHTFGADGGHPGVPHTTFRRSHSMHSIWAHDLSSPYHTQHPVSNSPHSAPLYPGVPGGMVAGVHTCDVPHCTSSYPHPPQLTAKQKRHIKRMEERELVAIVLDTMLQIAAFTTAIVFGIWAVKSYNVSVTTLQVQWVANQISLRSLCADSGNNLTDDDVCKLVMRQSLSQLLDSGFSTDTLGGNGAPKAGNPGIAPPEEGNLNGGHKLSLGGIVGIVFGVIAFILGNLALMVWRRFRMLRKVNRHIGTANCVDD